MLCSQLLGRTQGLFGLVVQTCDGSRRAASSLVDVDLRTFESMRNVPTLGVIARVGRALGLEAGMTVEVLSTSSVALTDASTLRAIVHDADLDDDAVALERASQRLQSLAQKPTDIGLAHLVRARACVARGDVEASRKAVDLAMALGIATTDRNIAAQLAETIHFESLLGAPWAGDGARNDGAERLMLIAAGAGMTSMTSMTSTTSITARRLRCWQFAQDVLAPRPRRANAIEALSHELEEVLSSGSTGLEHGRALAWTASISAMTALKLRARQGSRTVATDRVMALIVASELALESALAHQIATCRTALLARGTRVALCEWWTRACLGEIDVCMLDDMDVEELVRACLHFPSATRSPLIGALMNSVVGDEMNQNQNFTLDM
jgi:hypothetical protein